MARQLAATTRPEAPAAASAAVLHLPEILECILIHLTPRDLLVSAQRVCRDWQSVITRSPELHKHLFFVGHHGSPFAEKHKNPLLREAFGPQFFDIDTRVLEVQVQSESQVLYVLIMNYFLSSLIQLK
ncbi:F-box protein, partial [Corallococcus sp. CA041A]|uniref:F-box protein n=1 Tax=Corallococcus sp. CA041A TaxID=2316727 RepID=UPI000EF06CE5